MPRKVLKLLGLNEREISIYLTCLSLGQSLVSTIAQKSGINRASLYQMLDRLVKSGYLTFFLRNRARYYASIDPEILQDRLKSKILYAQTSLHSFEKVLPYLQELKEKSNNTKIEFHEGQKNIIELYSLIVNLKKPILKIAGCQEINQQLTEFLKTWHDKRNEDNIHINIITTYKKIFDKYRNNNNLDIKLINEKKYPLTSDILICDSYVLIFSINQNMPFGILINNINIACHFRFFFQFAWDFIDRNINLQYT